MIQAYEQGEKPIATAHCTTVLALADALEVGVRDIIYNENNKMTLQQMRLKRGLSQSQLAKKAGVPLSTIKDLEQKRTSLINSRLHTALKLAQALGCDIRDILG
jgi:DNA-binding XRE family transcriptional regulator